MTHAIAEIVTFKLADGITDRSFVELSQTSEAFVRTAPGFLFRRLSKGEDGSWTDYVVWRDRGAAYAAAALFPQQDCAQGMMQAIDPASLTMRHETILWDMAA